MHARVWLREMVRTHGVAPVARLVGVTRPTMYALMDGRTKAHFSTCEKIAAGMAESGMMVTAEEVQSDLSPDSAGQGQYIRRLLMSCQTDDERLSLISRWLDDEDFATTL